MVCHIMALKEVYSGPYTLLDCIRIWCMAPNVYSSVGRKDPPTPTGSTLRTSLLRSADHTKSRVYEVMPKLDPKRPRSP